MSAHSSPARARHRADILFAMAAVAGMAFLAWVVITMQQLSNDLRTANDARDALARQVQTLGHKPVAGPPGSRGEPGKTVVGPRGPRGLKGDTGASGKPAPTITPSPGATGPAGKDGADSTVPGPSGAPGADSTVAGPAGPTGPAGKDGVDGRDGADGKPPAGWSFTYNGADYTCRPVDNFDPDDPQYDCEPNQPQPGGSDTPSPQAAGLDPSRRQYV